MTVQAEIKRLRRWFRQSALYPWATPCRGLDSGVVQGVGELTVYHASVGPEDGEAIVEPVAA